MTVRQRNWMLMAVVLVFMLALSLVSTPSRTVSSYFEVQMLMVIACQGGDGLRPGNTMLAFSHADRLGADVLEMDVHATRDGVIVLLHDETVNRTTNGSGLILEMDLSAVKRLDAAYYWPIGGRLGAHLPTGVKG